MKTTIAVIIPAYNAERFLAKTVQSILKQTILPDEIIIIDDGSTDGTQRVAEKLMSEAKKLCGITATYYRNKENLGVSATRNRGAELAKAEYLVFCDADDMYKPGHIETLLKRQKRRDADLILAMTATWIDENDKIKTRRRFHYHASDEFKLFFFGLNGADMLVRRTEFLKMGGFNPKISMAEDWDYAMRMGLGGKKVVFDDTNTLLYRRHKSQATAKLKFFELREEVYTRLKKSGANGRQRAIFLYGSLLVAPISKALYFVKEITRAYPLFWLRYFIPVCQLSARAALRRATQKTAWFPL